MIDLPLLLAVRAFRDRDGSLRGDSLRSAVLAASIARGRVVTYGASMDLLREMGLHDLVAIDERTARLLPGGEAYLHSRLQSGETEPFQGIIDKIVGPSLPSPLPPDFVATLSRQVGELLTRANPRSPGVEPEIALGAILVKAQGPSKVYRLEFEPGWTPDASISTRWRDTHQAARAWRVATNSMIEVSVSGDVLTARAARPDCHLSILSRDLRPARVQALPSPQTDLWEDALTRVIRDRILERGWRQTGASGRAFFLPATERPTTRDGRPLREYDAFSLSVQHLAADTFIVWVDEFVYHVLNALDYIQAFGIEELLRAAKAGEIELRTSPHGTVAQLEGVDGDVDVRKAIAADSVTFYEYWIDRHGITLENDTQPILNVKTGTGSYSYPAELVRIDVPFQRIPKGHDPRLRPPQMRSKGIQDLSSKIFEGGRLVSDGFSLTVESCVPTLGQLRTASGIGVDAILRSPPLLLFGEAFTGSDPIQIFERAPFAGGKELHVDHVFWPEDLPRERVESFLLALVERFVRLRLGRIFIDNVKYVSYSEPGRREEIASLVRPIRRTSRPSGSHLSIAILGEGEETYQAFKRYYPDFMKVPIQSTQSSTVIEVDVGDTSSLDLLALNCYLKVLGPGEPAWALALPAGNRTDKTAFLGIGFSRRLNPKKTGKAAVALHDSRGFGISWTLCVTPGVERTIDRAWFQMLLDQLVAKWDMSSYDRIVIFRRGRIDPVELSAISEELAARHPDLGSKFKLIAVVDSHRRFFRKTGEDLTNPEPGTVLFLPDGTALVAASGIESREVGRGTIVPVELSIPMHNDDIRSIAVEYLDLTYLSWSNPQTTWKYPLVLRLADHIAALAREGVPDNAIFYLPL